VPGLRSGGQWSLLAEKALRCRPCFELGREDVFCAVQMAGVKGKGLAIFANDEPLSALKLVCFGGWVGYLASGFGCDYGHDGGESPVADCSEVGARLRDHIGVH
jgi:hypothetical protein